MSAAKRSLTPTHLVPCSDNHARGQGGDDTQAETAPRNACNGPARDVSTPKNAQPGHAFTGDQALHDNQRRFVAHNIRRQP